MFVLESSHNMILINSVMDPVIGKALGQGSVCTTDGNSQIPFCELLHRTARLNWLHWKWRGSRSISM